MSARLQETLLRRMNMRVAKLLQALLLAALMLELD